MRPSGGDVDKNYSCNHLGFWSSSTVNPSSVFISESDTLVEHYKIVLLKRVETGAELIFCFRLMYHVQSCVPSHVFILNAPWM